jgi:thioredoxin 1
MKALIVALLLLAVGAVLYAKRQPKPGSEDLSATTENAAKAMPAAAPAITNTQSALPRLVDLGAGKCIPCKMMAPILDDLKKEYAGIINVQFIDVWENPEAGEKYGIETIPTQIFYDAAGNERFRHQGFFAKDDILAKWKDLGVDLSTVRR